MEINMDFNELVGYVMLIAGLIIMFNEAMNGRGDE